jgi:hypothetical protein
MVRWDFISSYHFFLECVFKKVEHYIILWNNLKIFFWMILFYILFVFIVGFSSYNKVTKKLILFYVFFSPLVCFRNIHEYTRAKNRSNATTVTSDSLTPARILVTWHRKSAAPATLATIYRTQATSSSRSHHPSSSQLSNKSPLLPRPLSNPSIRP